MRAPVEEKVTSEQIAELRETLRAENTPVWGVYDGKTVTWTTTLDVSEKITFLLRRWLPRLLDEREALLEAVRFSLNTTVEDGHEEVARLEAALAKAESP